MKKTVAVSAAVTLALGCQRPEIEAFRLRPLPIVVKLDVPRTIAGSETIQREYAAALRSRLALRAPVVVDGAVPPPAAAELLVSISDIRPARSEPSPAAVGVATGVLVGTLSAVAGNRNAVADGLWWGLWTGSHAAAERRAERYAHGYRPNRINAVAYLQQKDPAAPGKPITLMEFDVSGYEVIEAMRALAASEQDDAGRIREEEARALARVVVRKLEERFGWTAKTQPDYYGLPKPAEPEPRKEGEVKPPAPPQ